MRIVIDHSGVRSVVSPMRSASVVWHTLSRSARLVLAPARSSREDLRQHVLHWGREMFDASGTTLRMVDHGLPDGPCVLVSNHRSLLDPAAIVATFPGPLTFVAKQELRSVPVFGRALHRYGVVFVERKRRARAIEQLGRARQFVAEGQSIWMSAEGSRGTGPLRPFKKGPFYLALQLQIPLVPTWIAGTDAVLAPDAWVCRSGQTVEVRYGAAIPTEGRSADDRGDREALMEACREALLRLAE